MPAINPIFYIFIGGAVSALACVAALLFAQFYRRTKDRLFLFFSAAFLLLSLNNVFFLFLPDDRFSEAPEESKHPLLYGIRVIAFGLILFAIVDKNRSPKGR